MVKHVPPEPPAPAAPPGPEAREESGTKEHILTVAERVFGDLGYAKATTRRIAQEAGIAPGLLFYYFKTKHDLYEAVVYTALGEVARVVLTESRDDLKPPDTMRAFVGWFLNFTATHQALMKIFLRELIDGGELIKEISEKFVRPMLERGELFIGKGIEDGYFRDVNPAQFLLNFVGAVTVGCTSRPVIEAVSGVDAMSPAALEERRKSILRQIERTLIA
ncbi:MAG: TetR/AcrR family transcriptional regulator [Myxococcales bacterium]|nr:TetR/AcrR family transcriptional regulator [Myxococcales bacterium]